MLNLNNLFTKKNWALVGSAIIFLATGIAFLVSPTFNTLGFNWLWILFIVVGSIAAFFALGFRLNGILGFSSEEESEHGILGTGIYQVEAEGKIEINNPRHPHHSSHRKAIMMEEIEKIKNDAIIADALKAIEFN